MLLAVFLTWRSNRGHSFGSASLNSSQAYLLYRLCLAHPFCSLSLRNAISGLAVPDLAALCQSEMVAAAPWALGRDCLIHSAAAVLQPAAPTAFAAASHSGKVLRRWRSDRCTGRGLHC